MDGAVTWEDYNTISSDVKMGQWIPPESAWFIQNKVPINLYLTILATIDDLC